MTTKRDAEPVVLDVEAARAALEAPACERAAAEALAQETDRRQRQAALAIYAWAVHAKLGPVTAAWSAWKAASAAARMTGALRGRRFGPEVLMAIDRAIQLGEGIETLAGLVPAVQRVVDELAGSGLLPPERLDAILAQLDGWAERFAGIPNQLVGWHRFRAEAVILMAATREALGEHIAWLTPPAEPGA